MTTIIFPGQGSQFTGMAKDFYSNFKIAKDTFQKIEDITKINIKEIIFENPSNLLNQTQFTQLSIFCASISIYNVLKSEFDINNLNINSMLGHSLGEYTALTAANIITLEDCAFLLKNRGELMQNAYPPNESGMSAIIGLNCYNVQSIIEKYNLKVEIANDNSPMQVVISGIKDELIKSENFFIKNGAKKFVLLNVSAAFHSKLMHIAEKEMKKNINLINFKPSKISIISNYSANLTKDTKILIENLSQQMSNTVRWTESIKELEKNEYIDIIEIGPGKVLSGLIKRISNKFIIKNIEYISDIEKIKSEF